MPRLFVTMLAGALLFARNGETQIQLTGGPFVYEVKTGDTLTSIGARYGVGVPALVALNHLTNRNTIAPGTRLSIDNRHLAVVSVFHDLSINIAQRMLYVVGSDGAVIAAYPVAVGRRRWPTPMGEFTVLSKETNPAWDVPQSIREEMRQRGQPVITRMPPSRENPLGAHWLGLSIPSLGIHGTAAPSSVYQFISHGCIRLHPDDVADLFARVSVGDSGVLIYEPILMAMIGDRVFLEAHDDVYRRVKDPGALVQRTANEGGFAERVDWRKAATVLEQRFGVAVDVTGE